MIASRHRFLGLLPLFALLLWLSPAALAPVRAETPDWAEPRALNIVDIAGQVPDEVLLGTFISSDGAAGVSEFVSSETTGDTLRITARVHARKMWNGATGRWSTKVPLLGQRPTFDHMGSTAPESWVTLYENGQPLTLSGAWIEYLDPAVVTPSAGAWESWRRYREVMATGGVRVEAEGIHLPANYGGELCFDGDHPELTAVFTVRLTTRPRVTYLSTQASEFQSYIGPGGVGLLSALMGQMQSRYGDRHGRIPLTAPLGADYVLFQYPMIPFYVYDEINLQRPSTGSVRLAPAEAQMLSADLVHGGAYPLRALWQDADQVTSSDFLTRLPAAVYVSPPEYVVASGISYNECFRSGGCPAWLLDSIYNARMTLRMVYLKVEAPGEGTTRVPLRMADDTWMPGVTPSTVGPTLRQGGFAVFMPFAVRPETPSAPREVPLGVFDNATGRMLDYLP